MFYYEIVESEFGLKTRKGWITSETELTLDVARAQFRQIDGFKTADNDLKVEALEPIDYENTGFKCQLLYCERLNRAALCLLQWPEDAFIKELQSWHTVTKI